MSTPDPTGHLSQAASAAKVSEVELPDGLHGVARDFRLPSAAVVEQLANEMFRGAPSTTAAAIPPQTDVTGLTLAPITTALVPPQTVPAIPTRPSTATAGAIPASIPGVAAQAPVSVPLRPNTGFSFLDDARPIFTATAGAADLANVVQPADLGIPFEGELRDFSSLSKVLDVPSAAAIPTEPVAPSLHHLPGVPTSAGAIDPTSALTQDLRSLVSIDVVPSVEPQAALGAVPTSSISSGLFDVNAIRRDFPILSERVDGRPLIWFDNAATTQKPQSVIDRISYFYEHENSNIHRAAHTLAARSTDAYEGAREKVRRFLNASTKDEIVFVRGATEGINLIAQTYGKRFVNKDDEVVVTHLEHHANIVPWQMLCAEKGARLRVAPVDDSGQIILEEFERVLSAKTKIVSIAHVSNALGTVTPVEEMTKIAKRYGAIVVIDGAQAVSHMRVDVQQYDCDYYVFSGHKVFAPTGIGVVYGKQAILEQTPPYQGGGNMISDVTFEKTQYHGPPMRFEAGTGSIADAVGLGAAIDYVERVGMHNIARYEHDLLVYGTERLLTIPGLRLVGTAKEKASVMSFVLDGHSNEEVGQGLSKQGIAVRSGHHCAQPILRRFGLESSVRPSLAFYNTCEEIDQLIAAIWNIKNGNVPSVV